MRLNMSNTIIIQPLTSQLFEPFGDVIDTTNSNSFQINKEKCTRHHAISDVEIEDETGKPIISIFSGTPYALPLTLDLVERHPLGSQAFIPMHDDPFLVIVCADKKGIPQTPQAFITKPRQGINLKPNIWHGVLTPLNKQDVLTPLNKPCDFLVIDRGDASDDKANNLEEYTFDTPYIIAIE